MAKSSKIPMPQVVEYTYTLELSEFEASVIMALVGAVGGQGEERKTCGDIYQALKRTGLSSVADHWGGKETIAMKMADNLKPDILRFEQS